jgi:glycosyltransferase involved in cell wall biosynthesis
VSVVIPTYNGGAYISQAIDSLLAQTLPPAEIIVVDDGSTDDTRGALAPYGASIRYFRQQNRDVFAARNRGVEKAKHELIAFLDSDDVWHPRKLELQTKGFMSVPGLGILGISCFL